MCGICGIVSGKNIVKDLVQSMKALEYRGYDSCGIAVINSNGLDVRKNVGTVEEVELLEKLTQAKGWVGIGHTRWATHGKVSRVNSHPHLSCDHKFAVVHNGIISNHENLRNFLENQQHKFVSETDTEIIAHLLEHHFKIEKNVEKALVKTVRQLEGTYAFVVVSTYEPEHIFCTRCESPLVLGLSSFANYIGSDPNAFISYTKSAVYLEDGDYAIVSRDSYAIRNIHDGEVEREVKHLDWDPEMAQKSGYPHFMLKEIYEQPQTILNALAVESTQIKTLAETILQSRKTYLVGMGTAYYMALLGQYYYSMLVDDFIPAISADDFNILAPVDEQTFMINISQSGETYDTMRAIRLAKKKHAKTAAIVNVQGSSIAREVDQVILQNSGPEICVLSTKAALAQIVILIRVAMELGKLKGVLDPKKIEEIQSGLAQLPDAIQNLLDEKSGLINRIAKNYKDTKNWIFLGRGIYQAVSLEAALKFKEVTYKHAEAISGGSLKHGPISMIDKDMQTVAWMPPAASQEIFNATITNVQEVRSRNGPVIGFHFGECEHIFNDHVQLPIISPTVAPLLLLVAGQLFAYFSAVALKLNIDKPRSLAKSVTVA